METDKDRTLTEELRKFLRDSPNLSREEFQKLAGRSVSESYFGKVRKRVRDGDLSFEGEQLKKGAKSRILLKFFRKFPEGNLAQFLELHKISVSPAYFSLIKEGLCLKI